MKIIHQTPSARTTEDDVDPHVHSTRTLAQLAVSDRAVPLSSPSRAPCALLPHPCGVLVQTHATLPWPVGFSPPLTGLHRLG